MNIIINGFDKELEATVKRICKKFDFLNDFITVEINKWNEKSLKASYDGNKCSIYSDDITGVLRGTAILSDKVKKNEAFSITENKAFKDIGILIDLSRNAVLKIETMTDILDRISVMGINFALFYMEDTYELEGYPYFGYMRGRYSKEDLKFFDKYALSLGIEIIPNIQTLSHLENPLFWSKMSSVSESSKTLLVDEPKTYEFIDSILKTMRECFSTNRIHLGLDEAHDLGRGKHLDKYGYEKPYDIMCRHVRKVCEIAYKYDFNPIMCDDMFHRMFGNGGYYQADAVFPDNISEQLPENLSLNYWDYYNESPEFISRCIRKTKEIKRPIFVYGGLWTWSGFVNYDKVWKNSCGLIKACKIENVDTIAACMFGDDGSEVSIYSALLGIQLFAEAKYGYEPDDTEHIKEMFKICTGYNADSFLALDIEQIDCDPELRDRMPGYAIRANTLSKPALLQDILQGLFDYHYSKLELKDHYIKMLKRLKESENLKDLDYLREYSILACETLVLKSDMGIRLKKAYDSKDTAALKLISDELEALMVKMKELHEKFAQIWMKNNKPFGYDRCDIRFGGLRARTETAYKRLNDYLSGKIDTIEELEVERLSYDGKDIAIPHLYGTSKIISASQFR